MFVHWAGGRSGADSLGAPELVDVFDGFTGESWMYFASGILTSIGARGAPGPAGPAGPAGVVGIWCLSAGMTTSHRLTKQVRPLVPQPTATRSRVLSYLSWTIHLSPQQSDHDNLTTTQSDHNNLTTTI